MCKLAKPVRGRPVQRLDTSSDGGCTFQHHAWDVRGDAHEASSDGGVCARCTVANYEGPLATLVTVCGDAR